MLSYYLLSLRSKWFPRRMVTRSWNWETVPTARSIRIYGILASIRPARTRYVAVPHPIGTEKSHKLCHRMSRVIGEETFGQSGWYQPRCNHSRGNLFEADTLGNHNPSGFSSNLDDYWTIRRTYRKPLFPSSSHPRTLRWRSLAPSAHPCMFSLECVSWNVEKVGCTRPTTMSIRITRKFVVSKSRWTINSSNYFESVFPRRYVDGGYVYYTQELGVMMTFQKAEHWNNTEIGDQHF